MKKQHPILREFFLFYENFNINIKSIKIGGSKPPPYVVFNYKNFFTASSIGAAAAECTPPNVFALYAQDSNSTLQVPS